ncbi:unnamed protein product [Mesocestoides corti]|uniref:SAYSvFN domain-containing protein n=1 Tax=Mesocestoides corti TaxID=53468 RepID=A0A0R3UDT3_MESCO|nr:unnamed protein product [Mesocestoides corti]
MKINVLCTIIVTLLMVALVVDWSASASFVWCALLALTFVGFFAVFDSPYGDEVDAVLEAIMSQRVPRCP